MKKRCVLAIFLCLFVSLIPVKAFAVGSYGVNIDDYMYTTNDNPFYAKGYYGQCTWYCWGRAVEKCGECLWWGSNSYGNAINWYNNAQGWYVCDETPSANSIMVSPDGGFWGDDGVWYQTGHVMFVEKVEGDYAYISEANYNGTVYHEDVIQISNGRRNWGNGLLVNVTGYIHVPNNLVQYAILDVNGLLDGSNSDAISNYGTFDIYINGSLAGDDVSDYYATLPVGTTYEIKNIKALSGKIFAGLSEGSTSGTLNSNTPIRLAFNTCTNHTYNSGVVTKAATCTADGVCTYTCSKCKATKTETIPKLDHTPVVDPAVPASVNATGLTEGSHCSVCGTVLKAQEIVPKLPRVLYDFDMDGSADPVIKLPVGTVTIEEEAFAGSAARAVIIPAGVTVIGSRAFADMPGLTAVFLPETVKTISFDVFDGSPNVTLYVQKGSRWGNRLDLPAVELESGWVEEDAVPAGAVITDEQWHYDYIVADTKKTNAPITEDGWTLVSTDWKVVSTGSQKYVDSYPSGYSGSKNYTTNKWTAYQTTTAKREVSTSFYTYIYWHWCFNSGYLSSENYNVYVSDIPYEKDSAGRYFQYFTAFESASDAGHTDPNGANGGDCFYFWRGNPEDGSWWWWRFPVYQQTRVDKQAEYTYSQNVNESRVSDTPVEEGGAIQNVKHLVQYSFA